MEDVVLNDSSILAVGYRQIFSNPNRTKYAKKKPPPESYMNEPNLSYLSNESRYEAIIITIYGTNPKVAEKKEIVSYRL